MTQEGRGPLPAKLYFRIGEVAGMVGVEPHVLRYWEREFRTIRPIKSAKGQRVYSRRDVENLMRVRDLLYGQGFTIAGARKRLRDKGIEPEPAEPAAASLQTPRTPEESTTARAAPTPSLATPEALPTFAPAPALSPSRLSPSAELSSRSDSGARAPAPPGNRMREQLEDLKVEIEAFLEELGA